AGDRLPEVAAVDHVARDVRRSPHLERIHSIPDLADERRDEVRTARVEARPRTIDVGRADPNHVQAGASPELAQLFRRAHDPPHAERFWSGILVPVELILADGAFKRLI